jgi:hypothetical protein
MVPARNWPEKMPALMIWSPNISRSSHRLDQKKEGGHDVTERRRQHGEPGDFVLGEAEQHCSRPPFSLGARAVADDRAGVGLIN